MTAAVVNVICLLIISVSLSTPSGLGQLYERQLQTLSEVISGPAKGKSLALHLDTVLPPDVVLAVLGFEAIRRTPHLTLSLGMNCSHIPKPLQETANRVSTCGFSSSPSLLHVLLLLTPRPEVIQTLWLHWKPRNLLIFSLGSPLSADVLQDKALSGVEKLAFIGYIFGMAEERPDTLGVYTMLPFSSTGVQFIGLWKSETFNKWEALFPDRFPSFEGYTFQVASFFRNPPYLYSSAANPEEGKGGDLQIFKAMANKLNYSYTLTQSAPDGKWGVIENGLWVEGKAACSCPALGRCRSGSASVALLNNGGFLTKLVLLTPGDMLDQIRQRLDLFDNVNEALDADDEWYLVNERLYSGRLVWYFPKNTPWKQKFDQNIQRLNYFGLINHWFEVEFAEWVKDNVDKKDWSGGGREGPSPSLAMRHLQGVFYILVVSWIVSGIILLFELFTHCQTSKL
ncbi:hypothetical protein E2C01_048901 [Portunus trituberculatus]|uniref:Uncharacterized protein n=1 Tax=Portunus trituberculatus TaxID=210409 RepID=A0A5B7G4W2_PORTR|nr:hypothetical protein [Portunus trituberculatus]